MRRSTLLLVLAGVLWGTGGITGHALADVTGLSPVALGAYRLGVGGAVLALAAALTGAGRPRTRAHWRRILALATLAAVYQAAYFAAVALSAVGIATLVTIGSSPLVLTIIEAVRDRARPSAARLRPIALGLVGLGLLVGSPASGTSAGTAAVGALLALVSGSAFAVFVLVGRVPVPGLDQPTAVGTGFVVGGLVLGVLSFTAGGPGFSVDPRSAGLLALFVTVPTALAYGLYFAGLGAASAATGVIMALLEPLTATVLSVLIFHEHLGPAALVGALLLLGAVVDSARADARAVPTTAIDPEPAVEPT